MSKFHFDSTRHDKKKKKKNYLFFTTKCYSLYKLDLSPNSLLSFNYVYLFIYVLWKWATAQFEIRTRFSERVMRLLVFFNIKI